MDATVTLIGEVVVAELRAAGYMESTIGQYATVSMQRRSGRWLGMQRSGAASIAQGWGLSSRR